jgi:hypothetical protein
LVESILPGLSQLLLKVLGLDGKSFHDLHETMQLRQAIHLVMSTNTPLDKDYTSLTG